MTDRSARERINELAASDQRTKFARFLEVFDAVENAIAAGVRHETIRLALVASGLDMGRRTFETCLRRARLRSTVKVPVVTAIQPDALSPDAPSRLPLELPLSLSAVPVPGAASHDPASLRAIRSTQPDLDALSRLARKPRKT